MQSQQLIYHPILLDPNDRFKSFNPRYIDIHDRERNREDMENNLPYHLVDEFSHSLRIFNFSNQIVYISMRDGSISALRNTPVNDIQGKRCYHPDYNIDHRGKLSRREKREIKRRAEITPEIKEGLYIMVMRQTTSGTSETMKEISTVGVKDPQTGDCLLGDDINHLLAQAPDGQEEYTYHPWMGHPDPVLANMVSDGYLGPTLYIGEKEGIRPKLSKAVQAVDNPGTERYRELVMAEYFIPFTDIKDAPHGYLYIEKLDLAVGTQISPRDLIHPFSQRGKNIELRKQSLAGIKESIKDSIAGVVIVNIDNSPQKFVKSYFVNLNGAIVEALPVCDPDQEPGVYIFIHGYHDGDHKRTYKEIYLTHNEACSFKDEKVPRLFRDYTEAFTLGDMEREYKEREKQKEAERQERIRELELTHKQKLNELELEMNKRKAEYDAAKAELDQRKAEIKQHYEERSLQRKDDSEGMKFWMGFGGLIIGIASAVLLRR